MIKPLSREQCDVLIIGAGPAGAVAAALLCQQGRRVLVIERERFPRFCIGESLLPQCMEYLEQAGMLRAVVEAGFQFKNGASFVHRERHAEFDFRDKFTPGWGTTYQVPRARFDHLLAKEAERQGAEIRYGQAVIAVEFPEALSKQKPCVTIQSPDGQPSLIEAGFVLDASGFGRVLPRLLDLERPSDFPVRASLFTHVEDHILTGAFDRHKIRITVHPEVGSVWYWLIPFSEGRCSLGVVAEKAFLDRYPGTETERLQALVSEAPSLQALLGKAVWDTPARQISGYAANVKALWGNGYALLGNAGEFLDPVFSSGVTIAVKSAGLAAAVLARFFAQEAVDWEQEYAIPLKVGIDTFRTFVESWYAGGFQNIIFYENQQPEIRRMIASILAGYAWDERNPYVRESRRRLGTLEAICV